MNEGKKGIYPEHLAIIDKEIRKKLEKARKERAKNVNCKRCGKETIDYAFGTTIFCPECRDGAKLEAQRKYSKDHYTEILSKRKKEREEIWEKTKKQSTTISKISGSPIETLNCISRFIIPFSPRLSKNRLITFGKHKVFIPDEVRKEKEAAYWIAKNSLKDFPLKGKPGKIWIGLFIQKQTGKTDAINFVDSLCDIISKAIEINDRWFSIRYVDWEIVRKDPKIYIEISASRTGETKICRGCSKEKDLSEFYGKHYSAVCFSCGGEKFGKKIPRLAMSVVRNIGCSNNSSR